MNNFVIGFKRFITNKNVVTIIGVLVVLGILYWGYSSTIKKATNPISIPVASKQIEPSTQITNSDIEYKNVAASMVDDSIIRYSGNIIGMYTNLNVTVPEGSPFYSSWLVKVASTIHNYVNYIEKRYQKQYADIIYPALFGKPYEEPVQTSLFDTDELETDAETIDVSNEEGRTSGQFKLGNKQGVRFAPSNTEAEGQTSLDLDNTEEAE